MKLRRLLILPALAFLPVFLFAQIQLEGNLRLGDSAQVHTVYTVSGDRMVGRVIAYDKATISFELKNGIRIELRHDEIVKIVVSESGQSPDNIEFLETKPSEGPDLSAFTYKVVLKNGTAFTGILTRFTKSLLKLDGVGVPARINTSTVDSIVLIGPLLPQLATSPNSLHLLKTGRGDRFSGQLLLYRKSGELEFSLENGDTITLDSRSWQNVQLMQGPTAPVASRKVDLPIVMNGQEKLMFGATGFQLPKGQAELRSAILFFHTFDYGVTDFFSVGAGACTFAPFVGVAARAKVGGSIGKFVHLGIGGHAIALNDEDSFDGGNSWDEVLAVTASLTLGTREKYFNIGLLHGTENVDDEFNPDTSKKFTGFTMGGAYRISNHLRFFAEHFQLNWKDPETPDFSSIGFSWFVERHRIDIGLSVVPFDGSDAQIILPVAGYSVRF